MSTETLDSDDLYFDSLVRGYVEENARFVRRNWLAEELDGKLREPEKRFVLLTAEPGAGKSAFMAQLAHDHPEWLRYFIRRDQREVLADISARSLLLRVGYQLAARHPELFSKNQLSLSVKQRLGEVAEQGEAVGVEVGRLIASPFYRKVIEIEQQVQVNRGKVVGLRAKELYFEERLLPAEDLLHLALIDPARALQRADPKRQLVILIDALDEIRYHPSTDNILAWLTHCPELPDNIRFVLTSRPPDETLRLFCDKQASRLGELTIAEEDPHVKDDIAQFVTRLIGEAALAVALDASPGGAAAFAAKANAKAHGNLGYLDALARGLDQALAETRVEEESTRLRGRSTLDALLRLTELPADLGGLYAFFLHQIKEGVADQQIVGKDSSGKTFSTDVWPAVYDPILGVLAVAAEPVEAELIAKLGDIAVDLKWVRPALNRLRQFLDVVDGRYRFYHATVAEFLTAKETGENPDTHDLYQDAMQWHAHIVEYYRAKASSWATVDWNKVDAYGLNFVASHLHELRQIPVHRQDFYRLICKPFMQEKRRRYGTHFNFARDVEVAVELARSGQPPNLVQCVRGCLLYATLGSLSENIPPGLLGVLATLGLVDKALAIASLLQERAAQSSAFFEIGKVLLEAGQTGQSKDLLVQGLALAGAANEVLDREPLLIKAAPLLALVDSFDKWLATVDLCDSLAEKVHVILAILDEEERQWCVNAPILGSLGDRRQALAAANQIVTMINAFDGRSWKALALGSVARTFGQLGDPGRATGLANEALALARTIKSKVMKARALTKIAGAFAQSGDNVKAVKAAKDALNCALAAGTEDEDALEAKASVLHAIAVTLGRIGEFDMALSTADTIQSPTTRPEAMSAVLRVLIEAREFARAVRAVSSSPIPEEGWWLSDITHALARAGEKALAVQLSECALTAPKASRKKATSGKVSAGYVAAVACAGDFDRAVGVGDGD